MSFFSVISVFVNQGSSPSGAVFVFSLWEHETGIHIKCLFSYTKIHCLDLLIGESKAFVW